MMPPALLQAIPRSCLLNLTLAPCQAASLLHCLQGLKCQPAGSIALVQGTHEGNPSECSPSR